MECGGPCSEPSACQGLRLAGSERSWSQTSARPESNLQSGITQPEQQSICEVVKSKLLEPISLQGFYFRRLGEGSGPAMDPELCLRFTSDCAPLPPGSATAAGIRIFVFLFLTFYFLLIFKLDPLL